MKRIAIGVFLTLLLSLGSGWAEALRVDAILENRGLTESQKLGIAKEMDFTLKSNYPAYTELKAQYSIPLAETYLNYVWNSYMQELSKYSNDQMVDLDVHKKVSTDILPLIDAKAQEIALQVKEQERLATSQKRKAILKNTAKGVGSVALGVLTIAALLAGASSGYTPSYNEPINDSLVWVNPYARTDGSYVQGHYRTAPDGNPYNNFSTSLQSIPIRGLGR